MPRSDLFLRIVTDEEIYQVIRAKFILTMDANFAWDNLLAIIDRRF